MMIFKLLDKIHEKIDPPVCISGIHYKHIEEIKKKEEKKKSQKERIEFLEAAHKGACLIIKNREERNDRLEKQKIKLKNQVFDLENRNKELKEAFEKVTEGSIRFELMDL